MKATVALLVTDRYWTSWAHFSVFTDSRFGRRHVLALSLLAHVSESFGLWEFSPICRSQNTRCEPALRKQATLTSKHSCQIRFKGLATVYYHSYTQPNARTHSALPKPLRKYLVWTSTVTSVSHTKCILEKHGVKMWSGFNWLRTGSNDGLLRMAYDASEYAHAGNYMYAYVNKCQLF